MTNMNYEKLEYIGGQVANKTLISMAKKLALSEEDINDEDYWISIGYIGYHSYIDAAWDTGDFNRRLDAFKYVLDLDANYDGLFEYFSEEFIEEMFSYGLSKEDIYEYFQCDEDIISRLDIYFKTN